jgi:hypothetical protein
MAEEIEAYAMEKMAEKHPDLFVLAVDCSASITPEEVDEAAAELDKIAKGPAWSTLNYLDDIIEPKDWNDFVEYVDEVFNIDLAHTEPDALFSIEEMLEWADSYRGI